MIVVDLILVLEYQILYFKVVLVLLPLMECYIYYLKAPGD